ncbi:hypothetical protein D6D02_07761 [Aureobasidium pullulans]|nr:hypothetical protein D6D02_07761 [Aureobasidium pullulans]
MNSGSRSATNATSMSPPQIHLQQDSPNGPQISRKVKACAACRKQKIKCLMDNNGEPPCRRCIERGLSCVLNKSLQTLISERSQWKDDMHRDISNMHGAVQDILKRLSMPALQPLKAPSAAEDPQETSPYDDTVVEKVEDVGPSCDNSPKLPPQTESLQNVPIESLYQITRLRSLRAENSGDESKADEGSDVVSKGIVSLEDAQRLTTLYLQRLDHYAYSIANKFKDLQSIRRRSVALTNAILTVAALHDPNSNQLFGPCCREFKRVLAESMFVRRIDREDLRAMCIGSYWLSDMSYTLSGHAIRRAMGINLSSNYYRVLNDGSEDAADCLRLWYMLYICDQHLSILYGRPTTIRIDDPSLQGWERYLEVRVAVEQDRRTASQVALMVIMGTIREFFDRHSRDTQTLPQNLTEHINSFDRQIDRWVETWYQHLKRRDDIGDWPSKGVLLHSNLARLHLHSHIFRGLSTAPIPPYFRPSASSAVSAANTIVEVLLSDPDMRSGLVGMPHYLHTMIAFACGFLLQMTTKYDGDLVQRQHVHDLINRLVAQLRQMPTGKFHLVRFMAEGLEKMVEASMRTPTQPAAQLFNGGFQYMNEQHYRDPAAVAQMDMMGGGAGGAGAGQHNDYGGGNDGFMIPDFGLSNSFLPFEDPVFRTSDFGYL